ncbi:efflux RND transporter periplasmic adaptor subunit [Vogesella oryzae]|uniref:efflux RND transporter periplasmic adaptor subunit n=1 Tax=Vogesella oryzae TaxID=1735285 RepID=UPI0015836D07|nr:efflux RND transporter periplasmic adaptor subunit [Vogesella oryzae]
MNQLESRPPAGKGWRKGGLIAGALLLLAVAGWWLTPRAAPAAERLSQKVTVGSLEKTVTAQGSLAPRDYVDVGAQVSGQISKVYVGIGQQVKQGQLLVQIDPESYQTKVDSDRAAVDDLLAQRDKQQASLRLASQALARQTGLAKADATSSEALETAQTEHDEAAATLRSLEAQIAKARATLRGDEVSLKYTRIYAPIDGTVVSQSYLQGQTINSSQSAPTILRVARLDPMTVEASVAEADVPQLKPGMRAWFTTLGDSQTRHQATVRQIKPTPTTTNDVVLYTVLLDVPNPAQKLMITMTAQVFFQLDQVSGLPVVPLAALKPLSQDGVHYRAQVLVDGKVQDRDVVVRLATRSQAAIASGLKAGDELMLATDSGKSSSRNMPPPPGG